MKNKLRNLILNSDLGGQDKLEALVLLDTALEETKVRDHLRMIMTLEDLYEKITGEEYKEALLEVIGRYKREMRSSVWSVKEEPVSLARFLKDIGVSTEGISPEKLEWKLVVGEDDGMGYTPYGFQDVIETYPDEENGEIKIWV